MVDRRRLSYRERWLDYEVGNMSSSDTADDSVDNELQLPFDVKTPLAIEVTGEEYGKLFASASLGADLLYSDEAHAILWLIWKAVKVATFCEKVASCVAGSAEVQQEIQLLQTIQGGMPSGGTPDEVLPEEIREETLLSEAYVCDLDRLYATCRGVVQAVHDATTEVFEAIEILTNPLELAAELADNVPIGELVAIGSDIILWVQNTAFEAYNLAWSETVKDEISCELFCLIKDNEPCSLSYEEIMSTYLDSSFANPPDIFAGWKDWAVWLFELPFVAANSTVKTCGLLGLLCMRFGAKYGDFNLGIRSLKTVIALLENDTDPDWAVICTECDDLWIHEWDFPNYGRDGWGMENVGNLAGYFQPGVGFIGQPLQTGSITNVMINRMFWEEHSNIPGLTGFRIIYDMERGFWNSPVPSWALYAGGDTYTEWNSGYATTITDGVRQIAFAAQSTSDIFAFVRCTGNTTGTQNGFVTIKRIELEGVGVDPFYGRVTADRHIGES